MKYIIFVPLTLIITHHVRAQSSETIAPFTSTQENQPQQLPPTLQPDKWHDLVPASVPSSGVIFYFDYTKFFEWLLPKKHPKIPPECDPKFFLDSIPLPTIPKQDSIPTQKPPV